mgnify:CR=1 FL=1|jgi:CRISPR-associated protein Cmr1
MRGSGTSLIAKLEAVTPLFLGGADPRGQPELRPPAFRGTLRYWLRAALGGVLGDADLAGLRQAEAQVFGSASEHQAAASPVTVRIEGSSALSTVNYSELTGGQQHRQQKRHTVRAGLAYLFFAARRTRWQPERKALTGSFYLQLRLRPGQSDGALQKAYAALWLLTHLGGVGSRARRGAGAVQAVDQNFAPIPDLPLPVQARTPRQLVDELQTGLRKIQQVLGKAYSPDFQKPSEFDIIHPNTCRIWVLNRVYPQWYDALDEIGRCFSEFRNRRRPDYEVLRGVIARNESLSQPVQRAAFGLPLPLYYRSLNQQVTLQSYRHDRRASPLVIRAVKLADGQYTVLLVWFQSRFLPDGDKLVLKKDKAELAKGPVPGDTLISTFITGPDPVKRSLRDRGLHLLQVTYG